MRGRRLAARDAAAGRRLARPGAVVHFREAEKCGQRRRAVVHARAVCGVLVSSITECGVLIVQSRARRPVSRIKTGRQTPPDDNPARVGRTTAASRARAPLTLASRGRAVGGAFSSSRHARATARRARRSSRRACRWSRSRARLRPAARSWRRARPTSSGANQPSSIPDLVRPRALGGREPPARGASWCGKGRPSDRARGESARPRAPRRPGATGP